MPERAGQDSQDAEFAAARRKLTADRGIDAADLPAALSDLTDRWLADLFSRAAPAFAVDHQPERTHDGVALVAVGGYGRSELCPRSDIDLLLAHDPQLDTGGLADRIWYPVWDQGLKLGHAVRTVEECIELAAGDVDTSTALLDARHVAGDPRLTVELRDRIRRHWSDNPAQCLADLLASTDRRHRLNGEVAFLLEPNLKLGRGGLRDVHTARWAAAAGITPTDDDRARLDVAHRTLLRARVALHLLTGRASDVLPTEEQQPAAELLGVADSDTLMYDIAGAARDIAYISSHLWRARRSGVEGAAADAAPPAVPAVPAGLAVRDGELAIDGDPAADPVLVLRAAVEAARLRVPLSRAGLERLADAQPEFGDPWPDGARELFVELLAAGDDAIDVVEALDFAGVWTRLLPEWAPNRNRPQRSHYHRFTVDRHLLEAVATAARYTRRVARPDLLLMGALLHDLGKGYPGDHTEVGMRLAADIGRRCGYDADDTSTLVRLVQHHLLLTDTAHRRDLHDPLTIAQVAEATGTVEFLELLATLTEADCRATGPTAWTDWIADLVGTLVGFVADHLIGDANLPSRRRLLLTDAVEQMMSSADTQVVGAGNTVTVVAPDERGTLSRAAGALALRGLDVLQAEAYSSAGPPAMAVSVFRVVLPDTPVDWERVANDVRRAVGGGLALEARIVERARLYRRRGALAAATPPSTVTFDTTAATDATIVQVHTEDHIGVLYRLTRILTEMGLDIVSAKIQTMANEVVDTFYVVGPDGPTLTAEHQREIELALRHGLSAGQE